MVLKWGRLSLFAAASSLLGGRNIENGGEFMWAKFDHLFLPLLLYKSGQVSHFSVSLKF